MLCVKNMNLEFLQDSISRQLPFGYSNQNILLESSRQLLLWATPML